MAEDEPKEIPKETPKDETPSVIEVAQKLHDDIKSQNDRTEKLLERNEALHAKQMLGGKSTAGTEPEKEKEETAHEHRMRINKELAEGKFDGH